MLSRLRTPLRIPLFAMLLWGFAAAASADEIVYTRGEVVSATAGEARLRKAYTQRLSQPDPDCADGEFTCEADRVYGQLYAIDFVQRVTDRGGDGVVRIEEVDRGRLLIALDLSSADEGVFEDSLRDYLENLNAQAYTRPLAGMTYGEAPLEQATLERSELPAWICEEIDDAYIFDMVQRVGESGLRSFSRPDPIARSACEPIASSMDDALPDTFVTLPELREQILREVRLAEASTYRGMSWAEALPPPDDVEFRKSPTPDGEMTGSTRDRKEGVFVGHEGRYDAIQRTVTIPASRLELLAAPMWVSRWEFVARLERFGPEPASELITRRRVWIAVVPMIDPAMSELDRGSTGLSVPDSVLVDSARERFESFEQLDPPVIEDLFADPSQWPPIGDWIVVTCRADGSARFGISPFAFVADVLNPREACSAVVREIRD
ncbi:hypothetical protein ABI59_11040 [Acidobacteria bacterium Mor1]|nr:hypothetical protein ABI59_11040 [Acidobacteria bacterium Mor1]